MTPSPPARHEPTESWLTSRGVTFSPPRRIPLEKIKRTESRQNQARAEALLPETVDRYVAALRAGAAFPPIVVFRSGGGYRIIDGNHRDESHVKAGREDIAVYTVADDTPSETIELLTVEANTRHGQPTDQAWLVTQALHLLATGHDIDTVTSATGVTEGAIRLAKRSIKADERARRLGIFEWERLSTTARASLSAIPTDPVFAAAAEVVLDSGMSTDDLKGFLRQIKAANSEADALRVIGSVAEERKTRRKLGKGRNAIANPRNRVLSALGAVTALDPANLPRLFHTDEERKEVAGRCADAAVVLMEMEEVLRRALEA